MGRLKDCAHEDDFPSTDFVGFQIVVELRLSWSLTTSPRFKGLM